MKEHRDLRRRRAGRLAASLFGACLLLGAANASATTFTVNSTGDQADANPGTGGCATAVATCTLRAAIQEANHPNNPAADLIDFNGTFNGTAGSSTIALGSALPSISTQVTISGGDCDPGAEAKPCVGVSAFSSATDIFSVSASSAAISGLSLTGGFRGVRVIGGSGSSVRGSWFGLGLDGSKAPLTVGVEIDNSTATATAMNIGGSTPAQRNVFSYTTRGVDVFGADSNVITGNYFGALPNGTLPPNPAFATALKLQGLSSNAASSNRFGGPDAGTPGVCDGECNLVIDGGGPLLLGSGAAPAADNTAIVGNFLGLALDGVTAMPLGLGGTIDSGIATNTTIGGSSAADRNYIDAGTTGSQGVLQIDAGATGMVVQNNFFGLSASGTQVVANSDEAVRNLASGTEIRDNTFGYSGDPGADGALSLRNGGDGVIVTGNSFGVGPGGADVDTQTGNAAQLGVNSNSNQIGGTAAGQGNVFGFANGSAIKIDAGNDGDSNTIVGNRIGTDLGATASYPIAEGGIQISGDSTDNVVGGTTVASENVISNTGQVDATKAAVGVSGNAANRNALLRNRGSNNENLFFDLIPAAGPGNSATIGANSLIQAPTVGTLSTTQVSGSGASPNAIIRAYRTLGTGGDVQQFIGQVTANGSGVWTNLPLSPTQANGACVTVNQTDTSGNSSELTSAQVVGGGTCDADPPNTVLNPIDQPTLFDDSTPSIFFGTNPFESPVTFACALNPPGGLPVLSPDCPGSTYTPVIPLVDGTYTVSVAARDAIPNQDPTPATHTFTVDTTAPVVTIDSGPAADSTTADATPQFTFSATDLTAVAFQCRFDADAFAPCAGPGSHTPSAGLSDAPHTFDVRGTDALAHASTVHRAFTVHAIPNVLPVPNVLPDTTPPETRITKKPKKKLKTTKAKARVQVSFSSEDGATFECRLDKGAFRPCASPFSVKAKSRGGKGRTHTISVLATDAAGNVEEKAASVSFRLVRRR